MHFYLPPLVLSVAVSYYYNRWSWRSAKVAEGPLAALSARRRQQAQLGRVTEARDGDTSNALVSRCILRYPRR